jgi:hypothetical protein
MSQSNGVTEMDMLKVKLSKIQYELQSSKTGYLCFAIADALNGKIHIKSITGSLGAHLMKIEPELFKASKYGNSSILEDWIQWDQLHRYPVLFNQSVVKPNPDDSFFRNANQFRVDLVSILIEKHGDIELTF